MAIFFSNYVANKKLKKSESLCSLATLIILNLNEGLQLLQEGYPEIITKIKKKNSILSEDSAKSISSQFISKIKSFITTEIPIEKNWKQSPEWYLAYEIYQEAALICPENSDPWWRIIEILHHEGRNNEAFAKYSAMPNQKIDEYDMIYTIPIIIGMLISVGRKKEATDLAGDILYKFSTAEKGSSKDAFLSALLWESHYLTIDKINDYIDLIKNIDQSLMIALAKNIVVNAHSAINDDNLKDALAWINIATEIHTDNQEFLNIKKEIEKDLKEGNTWDSIKSADDFSRYLYRRLAHRFHPDLAKNDSERVEKTKIMSKINKAKGDNNLQELKKIAQEHAPDWVKYFKF